MGDGCGNEAESADEPGSRFGTLEITSRKGGKLQRPVKPEKQGADVSRKTGSHDGPERGWPREPRGSLEGSAALSVILGGRDLQRNFFAGRLAVLQPLTPVAPLPIRGAAARSTFLEEVIQVNRQAAPRFTNKTALSVVITRLASTGSAFHLSQGSPLEAACFSRSHCGPILPRRRLRKIFPPTAQPLFTEMLFLCAVRRPLFGDTP